MVEVGARLAGATDAKIGRFRTSGRAVRAGIGVGIGAIAAAKLGSIAQQIVVAKNTRRIVTRPSNEPK